MERIGFIQCAQAGSASQFHDASSVEGALRTQSAIMHSRIRIVGGICFGVVAEENALVAFMQTLTDEYAPAQK
jgi:hypothetical protein